ncbi:unnamed protein product [Leuciscus chuanchicus]
MATFESHANVSDFGDDEDEECVLFNEPYKGHTLDLVITNSAPLTNLQVYDLGVSDHKVISMDLPSPSSLSKPKRNICFRNLKNINPELLAADFQHLSTHFLSADEAVDYYNSHLSSLLDLHAPVKTRTVTFTRSAPWFTDGVTLLKPHPHSHPHQNQKLSTCLEEIKVWMEHNFLQLNSSETEAILVGTPHQIKPPSITSITFSGTNIPLSSTVTNLGVKMDSQLTFEAHINHLCKTSFYHLHNISKLHPILTLSDAEKLVHAFVSSRLEYCNALLIGIPRKSLQRLQTVHPKLCS